MRNLLCLNLLSLILILVFCIGSVSFSYKDLDSSKLLHSVSASHLFNLRISDLLHTTVLYSDMAPKNRMTARKRMLGDLENEGTSRDSQAIFLESANIPTVAPLQNLGDRCPERSEEFDGEMRNNYVMAKKNVSRKRDFFEHLQDEGTSADLQPFRDENMIQNSLSVGQASYQKSKQGAMIEYKDIGDDIFRCIHCNARFWLDEANKRDSRNAPIVYTGCCQEGQITTSCITAKSRSDSSCSSLSTQAPKKNGQERMEYLVKWVKEEPRGQNSNCSKYKEPLFLCLHT